MYSPLVFVPAGKERQDLHFVGLLAFFFLVINLDCVQFFRWNLAYIGRHLMPVFTHKLIQLVDGPALIFTSEEIATIGELDYQKDHIAGSLMNQALDFFDGQIEIPNSSS